MPEHFRIPQSRREFFSESFCGFGAIALGAMMQRKLGAASSVNPLAPKPPHMPERAKAKAVIFLFLAGGPSHVDSFDPKPLLNKMHGQKRPPSFGQFRATIYMTYQNCYPTESDREQSEPISCGLDAQSLPVCLFENPYRLVSLWDIVNLFSVGNLMSAFSLLADHQARADIQIMLSPDARLDKRSYETVVEALVHIRGVCEEAGFLDSASKISFSLSAINRDTRDTSPLASAIKPELRGIQESISLDCAKNRFLRVPYDVIPYMGAIGLFGDKVSERFPSAVRDIQEAGTCLVSGCGTAAVFHLMRAAEIALRALANDRAITYPHSSVDEQQCGALIVSLDSKLNALRGADKKLWPSESVKNEQIRFYHAATIEFRSFNEAWRKQVCHAGSGSFYDHHQALSIFEHVKTFMQLLAPRISEFSVTPEYWTSV